MSEALRHLGIAAHACGELETARRRLEESTRLRREARPPLPAVAANLVGLAYIAAAQGPRPATRSPLIAEGSEIAQAAQADRILQQFNEARAALFHRMPGMSLEAA